MVVTYERDPVMDPLCIGVAARLAANKAVAEILSRAE
jgi:hypothetical protein